MSKPLVVAIDGPSGSGKSSTSRGVADRLSLAYLDTGAMYRAMTWALLERGVDLEDPRAIAAAAGDVRLTSGTDPLDPTIHVDGTDVAEPIRSSEVTSAVSLVAAVPEVRDMLVDLQRETIAQSAGIVVEGRDIGSTVAPDAPVKIYLVADAAARAARRAAETGEADTAATELALARRDEIDSTRAASPLAKAEGAVVVDGTHLTLEEVIDTIVGIVDAR
ncbi:(d)CMP kinase [Aeromicrobium sp. NPDC092404]|uniref:(d)CMP kinase n=1 Tax=Aeromicrobium sp. NPDC092404 TaxID=3154976 RepID=UPI003425EC12